jgi:hypothetical protein
MIPFLFLAVGVLLSMRQLAVWQSRQIAEQQHLRVREAYGELDLVFPTQWKKRGDPDLGLIVNTMNESKARTMAERPSNRAAELRVPLKPMIYRVDRPDGPWQMVLSFDPADLSVRAAAFGNDLSQPLTVHVYPCCR